MSLKAKPTGARALAAHCDLETVLSWDAQRRSATPLVLDRPSAQQFSVSPVERVCADRCLQSLGSSGFGIDFREDLMYEIRCGGRSWILLFHQDFLDPASIAALARRDFIGAAIAGRNERTGAYAVTYLALSSPGLAEGEAHVAVHRTTGRLAYVGTARVDATCASFSIGAASHPGAFAVVLEGRFDGRALFVDHALASNRIQVPKRVPVEE